MSTADTRGWGRPDQVGFEQHNITQISAGGIHVRCNVGVAKLFTVMLNELGQHYPLKLQADDWGYAYRPIRGYESEWQSTHNYKYLSNHSWGLAIDLDANKNPMTTDTKAKHEIVAGVVDPILAKFRGRIIWGGEYSSARKDYMHFEFVGTRGDADVLSRQLNL